jgi:hypothetical protein
MVLGERLAQELKELSTKLNNEGKLLSKTQLEGTTGHFEHVSGRIS